MYIYFSPGWFFYWQLLGVGCEIVGETQTIVSGLLISSPFFLSKNSNFSLKGATLSLISTLQMMGSRGKHSMFEFVTWKVLDELESSVLISPKNSWRSVLDWFPNSLKWVWKKSEYLLISGSESLSRIILFKFSLIYSFDIIESISFLRDLYFLSLPFWVKSFVFVSFVMTGGN